MSGEVATRKKKPIYQDLFFQVIVGMIAGVVLGLVRPDIGQAMAPLGDAFIKLIRMVITLVIFCTVVRGIAGIRDRKTIGRLALKTLVYFEGMMALALFIGLSLVNLWRPGVGMNIDVHSIDPAAIKNYITVASHVSVSEFILNIIPNSAVGAFAEGNVLPALFFSLLFAFGLNAVGESGKPVLAVIDSATHVLFWVVGVVMRVAPIGAFGALAFTVGKFGASSIFGLGMLILCFYATCAIFVVICLGGVAWLAGFSLWKFAKYIKEEILIVLATTSTEPVLPRLLQKLERLGCDKSVVGVVVPTGYSFNLEGTSLYVATVAVFLAQATNTPFGLEQQLGLVGVALFTAMGSAGVSGAAFIVLVATLAAYGPIPVVTIAIIIGVHRFLAEALTTTSLLGNCVATIVVSKWERALDMERLDRLLNDPLAKG
jgi:aerobic C4-dicarboxylate transport protein